MKKHIKKKIEEIENSYGEKEEVQDIKLGRVIDTDQNIHILDMNTLFEIISYKKYVYVELYHKEPQYIKIPFWTYDVLRMEAHKIVGYSIDNNIEKFMGMQIILTPTIESIHEIELL